MKEAVRPAAVRMIHPGQQGRRSHGGLDGSELCSERPIANVVIGSQRLMITLETPPGGPTLKAMPPPTDDVFPSL